MTRTNLPRTLPMLAALFLALGGCSDAGTAPLDPGAASASTSGKQEPGDAQAESVSVSMTGPNFIETEGVYTWEASASGGDGTYSYYWEYRQDGTDHWSYLGSDASYSRYVGPDHPSFWIRVTVTSAGQSSNDAKLVYVEMACYPGEIC